MRDKEQKRAYNLVYNLTHRDQRNTCDRAYRSRRRAYTRRLRAESLQVLGNICACPGCGVSEPSFLTIDHINGRRKRSKKTSLKEAKTSGWDKTQFQILCANCNFAKSDRGFCPVHQKDPGKRNGQLLTGLPLFRRLLTITELSPQAASLF